MMKRGGFLSLFCLSLLLSGCAGMNSQFDCNKVGGKGVGCVSLDQVNHMANQGDFNHTDSTSASLQPSVTSHFTGMGKTSDSVLAPDVGDPVRYSESIQQIWIAPYEDTAGNYHEPNLVYAVIQPSHWVGLPQKAIQDSDE